jgi:hypothetical protein
MADPRGPGRSPLDRHDPPEAIGSETRAAAGLSLAWLLLAGAGLFLAGDGTAAHGGALTALALAVPVGLIWVAAMAARAARATRDESRRLRAAIETIRESQTPPQGTTDPALARTLEEIAAAQHATQAAVAALAETQPAVPEPARPAPPDNPHAETPPAETPAAEAQPSLALGAEDTPARTLGAEDFIRALNFPETAEDRAGFAALRRALRDRRTAQFVTAAQDVLTLLSQEGLYMDDLAPDRAHPDLWRRFAAGERGRAVAALGGVHDRDALALAADRMRQDPIFRDATHHFLRLFDQRFAEFADTASDAEIAAFADTRAARAFMVLGRATGIFD